MEARTLRLPLSQRVFQVRGDGYWRELSGEQYEDELAGRFSPRPDEWAAPTEPSGFSACAERAPGAPSIGPTWWLVYGTAPDNTPVQVTLADGQQPAVRTFGPLWLCEWVSEWQSAVVSIGRMSRPVFDRIPARLRANNNDA